jgi:hypothetical protein
MALREDKTTSQSALDALESKGIEFVGSNGNQSRLQ